MESNYRSFLQLFVFFVTVSLLISCEHHCTPEVFLIPDGYRGSIYIIYNQKQGVDKEYGRGKRIYRIPRNGILLTKFKDEYGIINQEYYYSSPDGKRRKLGVLDSRDFNEEWTLEKNPHEPPRDSLAIFNPATVGVMGDNSRYKFQYTFIGTYNDKKILNKEVDCEYIDSLKKILINTKRLN